MLFLPLSLLLLYRYGISLLSSLHMVRYYEEEEEVCLLLLLHTPHTLSLPTHTHNKCLVTVTINKPGQNTFVSVTHREYTQNREKTDRGRT